MKEAKYRNTTSSNKAINKSTRYEENPIPLDMTFIICQRCGRKLGQVFSTNGVVTCDKCGYKSYTRIYKGAVVILPASYLQFEGYYDDADDYIHRVRDRVNADQVPIWEPVFDID